MFYLFFVCLIYSLSQLNYIVLILMKFMNDIREIIEPEQTTFSQLTYKA